MQTRSRIIMGLLSVFVAVALLFLANATYFAKKDRERLMALYGVDARTTRLGPNFLIDYYREKIRPAASIEDVHAVIKGYDSVKTEKKASLTLERYTFRLGLVDTMGITVAYDDRGRYLGVDESDRL